MTTAAAPLDPLLNGLSIQHDAASDFIFIAGSGFLQVEQFDAMFATVGDLVRACHRRSGKVRILVDNRDILLHSPEAAERLRRGALSLYEDGDRIAIIVESALARMQLRRLLDPRTHRLFETRANAIAWLAQ
ncbi:SpoIIAA family protein [Sphingomonas abietis]|uniref:STAS/SEC14 domain-containing protein n=1 Tax=Sphingomonas abietis TaxID=3012344 RepID=A0ABY7NJ17_9SPHN|nr:STAS/SEC14 domain-containing protein [Sphingomonas abietis]WBO21488.1 STAS/SEC14 domain-containing protein [Sphingomonas abietis]